MIGDPASFLTRLLAVAIDRARPEQVLPPWVERLAADPPRGRTIVVGAGKASAAMATVFARHWPADLPLTGAVVTRYGHLPASVQESPAAGGPTPVVASTPSPGATMACTLSSGTTVTSAATTTPCGRITLWEASHPTPDAAGVAAAQQILALAANATADDCVVCLLSGGGSALLPLTQEGVGLAAMQAITAQLLASGATIAEINCVRKHLSAILGGRLAAAAYPAPVVTLAISDVPGDDPAVIASGPTVPDPTTCAEALALLERYAITVPQAIRNALASGAWETPKPGDPCLANASYHLVATPWESLAAAADEARRAGVAVWLLADDLEGESRVVAGVHAALARTIRRRASPLAPPALLLSGGETTVTLTDRPAADTPGSLPARGGRNSEFALALALALAGEPGVWALAADTDGIDGSETNAGALVTPTTLARAAALGLDPRRHLREHDAYDLFAALGDLVVTGPTQTNVNDFRAVLVLPCD